jgi:uncharacterized protein CbrC (UPF0167 family)
LRNEEFGHRSAAMEKAKYTDLPKFKYHPNPFSSGSLIESDGTCECCGLARGYMYEGPICCTAEVEQVCPWCIANDLATDKWGAEFTDGEFYDSHGDYVDLPLEVWKEVFQRTLGVHGALQSVKWWVHCGEPAEFLRVEEDRVRFRCRVCSKRRSYRDLD